MIDDPLPGRGPTPQEQALADSAQELGRRCPPLGDPGVSRGHGCVHSTVPAWSMPEPPAGASQSTVPTRGEASEPLTR